MRLRYGLWFVIILTLLFLGVVCYWQSGKAVVAQEWLTSYFPALNSWIAAIASFMPTIYHSGWIEYHFADITWAASCAMLITGIWVNQFTILKLLLVGIGCAIFYEVLQLIGARQGIFDKWDLFYSLIAGVVATFISYFLLKRKDDNNEEMLDQCGH